MRLQLKTIMFYSILASGIQLSIAVIGMWLGRCAGDYWSHFVGRQPVLTVLFVNYNVMLLFVPIVFLFCIAILLKRRNVDQLVHVTFFSMATSIVMAMLIAVATSPYALRGIETTSGAAAKVEFSGVIEPYKNSSEGKSLK